jgi:hypothetical protein
MTTHLKLSELHLKSNSAIEQAILNLLIRSSRKLRQIVLVKIKDFNLSLLN